MASTRNCVVPFSKFELIVVYTAEHCVERWIANFDFIVTFGVLLNSDGVYNGKNVGL